MIRTTLATLAAIVVASTWLAAPAAADDQSYLDYLRDHGYGLSLGPAVGPNSPMVGTGIIPFPEQTLADGHMLCDRLHSGAGFDELQNEFGSQPYWHPIIDAAQRELCPDTL
jgi:hypothetical protein